MKIQLADQHSKSSLLNLMHEAYKQEPESSAAEWATIKAATDDLLADSLAGEAYLIFDDEDSPVGYMIMYRRFSLRSGGYITRIDDIYLRDGEPGRFRDQETIP
jgi:hypothetical protein